MSWVIGMYICKMNRYRLCKGMGLSYLENIRCTLKFETRRFHATVYNSIRETSAKHGFYFLLLNLGKEDEKRTKVLNMCIYMKEIGGSAMG